MPLKDRAQSIKESFTGKYADRGLELFRKLQVARGRHGWLDVLYESAEGFLKDRMTVHAGNFAYSAFLGLFPLLLFAFAVVGYLFQYDPETMRAVLDAVKRALPEMRGTVQASGESIQRLRGTLGVIGLVGLLWSMSRITYSFQLGFEAAWGMKQRGYIAKKLYSVTLMLMMMVTAVVGLGITFVTTHLFSWVSRHVGPALSMLLALGGHVVSPMASMFIFVLLYRSIPRDKPGWKEVLWAALPMALLLDLVEYLLGIYFTRISSTQALYGSMGIVIGIVLWLYCVGLIIFFGAEVVQTLQRRWAPEAADAAGEGPGAGGAGG